MISLPIKIFATLCCLLLFSNCSPSSLEFEESKNEVSINYLKSLCRTKTHYISNDISICGRVTANDALGEFYKSIVIEDNSGGIEVAINGVNLYEEFPIDAKVTILCSGLSLGKSGGKIELGQAPTGDYIVDGIDKSAINRYIVVDKTPQQHSYYNVQIDELNASHISRSVRVSGLKIDNPTTEYWCNVIDGIAVDTEHIAVDSRGNRLKIRLRGSCHYANAPLVEGTFTICGIIDYAGDAFYLRPANYDIIAE